MTCTIEPLGPEQSPTNHPCCGIYFLAILRCYRPLKLAHYRPLKLAVWKSKHKIENISASNTAMKLKLGEHVVAYEMYQMVYSLMLLW